MYSKKIIVALDSSNLIYTLKLVELLKKDVFAFKIGYQFFFNFGFEGYKKIYAICPKIFLDLKLHDIPNTVSSGIKALQKIKPLFTTIHVSGGDEMMQSTKKCISPKFCRACMTLLTRWDAFTGLAKTSIPSLLSDGHSISTTSALVNCS